MTAETINQYLKELEHQLFNQSTMAIESNSSWANQFPDEAAVYILKKDDVIVYIGETGNLKAQMTELASSKSFNDSINELLNDVATKHLKLSYLVVDLGRKELQERILEKIVLQRKPIPK